MNGDGARAGTGAPADVSEALARARRHALGAAAEATRAVRALLDAIALLQAGDPAASHPALFRAAAWLDALAEGVSPDGVHEARLAGALADALDAEIARWEERAREDPDARAVLRAFLGMRELLWELGLRPTPKADAAAEAPAPRARKRRVERVPVQRSPPQEQPPSA